MNSRIVGIVTGGISIGGPTQYATSAVAKHISANEASTMPHGMTVGISQALYSARKVARGLWPYVCR
jgi:hypothetical protein